MPEADAGPDQNVNESVLVTLDASGSTDPDNGIASYLWTQTAGTSVTLSDTSAIFPTFTSPVVGGSGQALIFQLTVTDNGGLQSTDSVIVNVLTTNEPPVADAGLDQTVDEKVLVTLDGTGSTDPDDGIVSYLWTQTRGLSVTLSDNSSPSPTFTSLDLPLGPETLTFELVVTDAGGLMSSDKVIVNINWLDDVAPDAVPGFKFIRK